MVSVDYILQHLPYVVPPYVHMLQKLLFKYAVYPFGNSVVTWVVPFRHAYPGVAHGYLVVDFFDCAGFTSFLYSAMTPLWNSSRSRVDFRSCSGILSRL